MLEGGSAMTRTKLMDREMPVYTKNEELFNMISHIVGGAVGVASFPLCTTTDSVWPDRSCSAFR